jgi:hypothetical protein
MAEVDMKSIPGAITKARSAGYSDDEIYNFLAQQAPGQFKQAKDAGYSSSEILGHFTGASAQPDQPAQQPAQQAEQPKEQPLSWGDVPGQALENALPSAGRLIGDVAHTVAHPIETLGNIKDLGLGILEKTGVIGSILPSAGGGHEKYADAVGKYFMDRYGSVDNIKKALATDPVGVAADAATVLTGGETALARAPGIIGKVGEVAGQAGRFIDPVRRGGELVQAAGKAATYPLGLTTGVGEKALQTAAQAGAEGGEAAQAFRTAIRGEEPIANVVQDAKGAVKNLRDERGIDYQSGMTPIKGDATELKWDAVDGAIKNMEDVATYKGKVIAPKTEAIRSEIKDVINHWKSLDPAEYHTPEGFDALKRQIGELRDLTAPHTPDRLVADQAYNAVKNTIVAQSPEYAKVMKGYEMASDTIKEIEKTLSLDKNANIDTSLRKLQSVMRNNVQTNYGRRTELATMLENAGAPNLMERLAGQSLSNMAPRGIARVMAGGMTGGPAALAGAGLLGTAKAAALAAPALVMASPRLMGEAAYRAGQASRYAPLIGLSTRNARQTGRLPEK